MGTTEDIEELARSQKEMDAFLNDLNESIAYTKDDVNDDLLNELEEMEKEEAIHESHFELPDVPLDVHLSPETDSETRLILEE